MLRSNAEMYVLFYNHRVDTCTNSSDAVEDEHNGLFMLNMADYHKNSNIFVLSCFDKSPDGWMLVANEIEYHVCMWLVTNRPLVFCKVITPLANTLMYFLFLIHYYIPFPSA